MFGSFIHGKDKVTDTVLDNLKTWALVASDQLTPALKSYSDSLLFYYLGHLAIKQTNKPILEIGVGGSTHLLHELSVNNNQEYYIVDINSNNIDQYTDIPYFSKDTIKKLLINSLSMKDADLPTLSYVHIDGDKNFIVTKNDLEYAASKLAPMGIICQDDYGNNKWPGVTLAVQAMINECKLELLFIGDSSCWLVKKQDHRDWIFLLENDDEFNSLRYLLQIQSSKNQFFLPEYLWMNSAFSNSNYTVTQSQVEYYKTLLNYNHDSYLRMPYSTQSQIGYWLSQYLKENN
jgi:hypothetical protein